jgi:hypothetical protein
MPAVPKTSWVSDQGKFDSTECDRNRRPENMHDRREWLVLKALRA